MERGAKASSEKRIAFLLANGFTAAKIEAMPEEHRILWEHRLRAAAQDAIETFEAPAKHNGARTADEDFAAATAQLGFSRHAPRDPPALTTQTAQQERTRYRAPVPARVAEFARPPYHKGPTPGERSVYRRTKPIALSARSNVNDNPEGASVGPRRDDDRGGAGGGGGAYTAARGRTPSVAHNADGELTRTHAIMDRAERTAAAAWAAIGNTKAALTLTAHNAPQRAQAAETSCAITSSSSSHAATSAPDQTPTASTKKRPRTPHIKDKAERAQRSGYVQGVLLGIDRVRKDFGRFHGVHSGTIVAHTGFFLVEYDDGDSEELAGHEIAEVLDFDPTEFHTRCASPTTGHTSPSPRIAGGRTVWLGT